MTSLSQNKGVTIFSLDANFGLVRKKKIANIAESDSRHGSLYFLNQDEVDKFVAAYNDSEDRTDKVIM